jgi:hypothetical protein
MGNFLSIHSRGVGFAAYLVVFATVLLGLVGGGSARAISLTPSTTEPYVLCPEEEMSEYACDEIIEPAAYDEMRSALGEISPDEEGNGELGGWSPENLRSAYNLPAKGGSGETVAIVDAFNYPDAEADLKVYREHYKLYYNSSETACTRTNGCFQKVNQKGESSTNETASLYPKSVKSWSQEMSLDLDMVSAVCPECKLLLVEANNNERPALQVAEDEAASLKPAAVSNSWGSRTEYSSETEDDMYFDHPGIPIVFSGGDHNYATKYPAASPYVIAVGGTELSKEPLTPRGWSERVWNNEPVEGVGTGSGCSEYEPKPTWQTDKSCAGRTENDVAAVAYNLSAYDSFERVGYEQWATRTGTSAAAPIIAGIEALSTTYARSLGAEAIYVEQDALNDIAKGNNGKCTPPTEDKYFCTAAKGYDGPSGNGTPDGPFGLDGPPYSITALPTSISDSSANLNGTLNPNGIETSYHFEYGTTTGYGTNTPVPSANIGKGTAWLEEKTAVSLQPETTYHYRVSATNSDGTANGADAVFTTLAPAWLIQPSGVRQAVLTGSSCPSATVCMAVGKDKNSEAVAVPLAEAWNGTEWKTQTMPSPTGATFSELKGISCAASTSCEAVGRYDNSEGKNVTLAESWNGSEWVVQSTPNPSGATSSELTGVSCAASTSCEAVGSYSNSEGKRVTLAESWSSSIWVVQSTPNPSGATSSELTGVSCAASTSCEAVGSYSNSEGKRVTLAESWSSSIWVVQSTPNPSGATSSELTGVSCAASTSCEAVGSYHNSEGKHVTLAESWSSSKWAVQSTPNPTGATASELRGVSCTASTSCETTGSYENTADVWLTLAEIWNGSTWTVQSTPNPSGSEINELLGVACLSSSACHAVGLTLTTYEAETTLAESWNGTEWKVESTPNLFGAHEGEMLAVSCTSSKACTAAGDYVKEEGVIDTLVEVWAGSEWTIQATPNQTGATTSILGGLSCTSSSACIAVGESQNAEGVISALAERLKSKEWLTLSVPNPTGATASELHGVSCSTSSACTAVGWYKNSSGTKLALAERWNGKEWVVQTVPQPTGAKESLLKGVSCPSSTGCTAAGSYVNSEGITVPLAESWNGTEWTVHTAPNPSGAVKVTELTSVSCTSISECTAVGWYYINSSLNTDTLAERWNGSEWHIQTTPNPSSTTNKLRAVSCSSATACTAAGSYLKKTTGEGGESTTVTLIEYWNGTEWKVQTTPNPVTATTSVFDGASCISAASCIASGSTEDYTLAEGSS